MQTIPLSALASQTLVVVLNGAAYTLNVYQKTFYTSNNEQSAQQLVTPVFLDIYLNGAAILTGALCSSGVKIVRNLYLGFPGDLVFTDTQGTTDPVYTGFGTRYLLVNLDATDLAKLGSADT